jgi:mRNA interferase MazF
MTSTTTYKQGDVVLVPYPFTDDQQATKKRPAIVLSICDCDCPENYGYILVAISSSNTDSCDYQLTGSTLANSGLNANSYVKTGSLFTISKKLILKKTGSIPPGETKKIIAKVISHIWTKVTII